MNEGTKTGVFWGIAVVMLSIASFVAWPASTKNDRRVDFTRPMFDEFKDPLAASSLKVVTFDELQGQLDTFEVRKDRQSGLWTIPSRNGYPADAVDHMRDAANSLVGLKILDVQTENAEDHDDLGVVEPKLEDLEIGDEGVGRLVTFKDETQKTLAALIIGKPVEGEAGKIYVRKPGQDPVYVVKFDPAQLSTRFQDWIEEDLLKLSSIDIEQMEIKDYNAAVNMGMQVSLTRNYTAKVAMDGSQWKLNELLEYDAKNPLADPKQVNVQADAKLNATKLNEMKNALDDLKIANVLRKPEGMSSSLRANKDLLSDDEAVRSLIARGFIPASSSGSQDDIEVLSANGELTVGLKDGVEYVLRFGNAAGLSEAEDAEKKEDGSKKEATVGGVNRYLLVTARVNDSHFPPPDLKSVPQSLAELEAMEAAAAKAEAEANAVTEGTTDTVEMPAESADLPAATEEKSADEEVAPAKETPAAQRKKSPAAEMKEVAKSTEETKSEDKATEEKSEAQKPKASESKNEPKKLEAPESTAEESTEAEPANEDSAGTRNENGVMLVVAQDDEATLDAPQQAKADAKPAKAADKPAESSEKPAAKAADEDAKPEMKAVGEELSEDEKLERLEAEQEKITKENQRKIDERKDKINVAERRVRELNARFADWYYVIAEDTYRKLRISRDQLFAQDEAQNAADGAPPTMPNFGIPGQFPGQFPGQP